MNPARVFAKQCAKTQAFDFVPSGRLEFDATSIAAACAGTGREYYLAARLYWMQDWTVASELERHLWLRVVDMANDGKWRIVETGKERLRGLAGLAVAETADPARWNNNDKRGEWMGVTAGQFRRAYAEHYGEVYDRLMAWCDVAAWTVRRRTKED